MKTLKEFLNERVEKILNKRVMTPEELAKKHKVKVSHIKNQLEMGRKVEMEHSSHPSVAERIALAHIEEDPNYYTKLRKIEKK